MNKPRFVMKKPCDIKQGDRISGRYMKSVLSSRCSILVVVNVTRMPGSWIIWAVYADHPSREVARLARYNHELVPVEVKP